MADTSIRLPKPRYGQIVVLQKNGEEPRGKKQKQTQIQSPPLTNLFITKAMVSL